jgi:hypothetical protein
LAAQVVTAPAVVVKALVYELYLAAGAPGLDQIAAWIRRDGRLDGALGRDTVARVIGKAGIPASQHDVVAVVTVLARAAAWDAQDATARGETAQTGLAVGIVRRRPSSAPSPGAVTPLNLEMVQVGQAVGQRAQRGLLEVRFGR